MKKLKFIDLFAGMGGLRLGFEQACQELNIDTECILTSEIKEHAISILEENFEHKNLLGDIREIDEKNIEDFDILLGGFPCQAFSAAGKRLGFKDTRGTLFFEVARILKSKKPKGFILENVEGLIKHGQGSYSYNGFSIGETLNTILHILVDLGYTVSLSKLDSLNFGVPQKRKRVFIVGVRSDIVLDTETFLNGVPLSLEYPSPITFSHISEYSQPSNHQAFTSILYSHYNPIELLGSKITDKRGGPNNIHSWDLELKGSVTPQQKHLLNRILKERRLKKYSVELHIPWKDGNGLTAEQIKSFIYPLIIPWPEDSDLTIQQLLDLLNPEFIEETLDILVKKGYLKYSVIKGTEGDNPIYGYHISSGNLSFEFNRILNPDCIVPTLTATDWHKLGVLDSEGIRELTVKEGLRLFGYPDDYISEEISKQKAFDLLGNTVVIPVVKSVSFYLLNNMINYI